MSLKTQILCGFRLFLFKKTVLEFGNEQHFAGCGCSLRLFADSLHRTQSANAAKLAGFMPILLLFTPLLKSRFFGFYVNGAILINGGTHAPAYIILHNHL